METIITYLIELSEKKLAIAKRRANQVAIASAARVADLDHMESPESIMLSSMTEDGANDRTDREVVVPWLRFVWENYRAVLELLNRLPSMQKIYHDMCRKAFQFCFDYQRKTEFRRLCDMLRNQLESLQKPQGATIKTAKAWEWTPETIEFHMQTKFEQLDKATSLELWNEAFRTIEDISRIMGKKATKSKSLITYYEKLTKIFWVADNKLFHAYALLKLFQLSAPKQPEEKQALASAVLLAALSVPPTATLTTVAAGYNDGTDGDDYQVDRNAELAALLDFHSVNPTRQSLLQEIGQKGIVSAAFPEFSELYSSMEVEFSPMKFVKKISPAVQKLRTLSGDLQQYALPLERNIVIKFVQQLSKVYSSVKLDYVLKSLSSLTVLSRVQIERVLVEAVRSKLLSLRISHINQSITFLHTVAAVQAVDSQVYNLGQMLSSAAHALQKAAPASSQAATDRANARKAYFVKVVDSFDDEYGDLLERRRIIEQRKEDFERLQVEKDEALKRHKELEAERRIREDEQRKAKEEKDREDEKRRKLAEEAEVKRITSELARLGAPKPLAEVTAMSPAERSETLKAAEAAFRKSKDDEKKRSEAQAKSFDYKVRAERLESFANVDKRAARWLIEDTEHKEKATKALHEKWTKEHEVRLGEKQRLSKFNTFRAAFEARFIDEQQADYAKFRAAELRRQVKAKRDSKIAEARKLLDDELQRAEEEERARILEEEERRAEAKRHEALRIQRENEERAERDREAQRATLERMRREAEEAEEKARKQREEAAANAPPAKPATYQSPRPAAAPAPGRYVPPTRQASSSQPEGGESSWRGGGGGFGSRQQSSGFGDRSDRGRGDRDREPSSGFGDRSRREPPKDGERRGGFERKREGGW